MQPVILSKTGQYATFKLSEPYTDVLNIRTFTEDLSGVGTIIKQFRWSVDGNTWSYWIELSQSNLNELSLNPDNPFYIEYKYQLATQGYMTISNVQIEPNYKITDPIANIVRPTLECGVCGIDRASILNVCNPTFNPYAVNPAMNLYKDMCASVQDLFGMEVLYMRAIPNARSGDVVFKEWTLYNVDEPVCSKVMVDNNEFPSNDAQYDMYGIGYEAPFEIEIVKENFERDFGLDAAPQKNDVIYFPILGNRLYEVQSSSPVQGFMLEISSWKCELTIYNPKSNRDMPTSVQDIMDDIMRSSETAFGEELEKETKELTKPQQLDRKLGTTQQDPVRTYVNPSLNIIEGTIANHATTIADHYYDMSSILNPNKDILGVAYRAISNFIPTQDFAFTTWFKHVNPKFTIPEDGAHIISKIGNTITVKLNATRSYKTGTLVHMKRQGRLSFYGIIVEIVNPNTFKIALNNDVVEYLNSLSSSWSTAPGYSLKRTFVNSYINGYGNIASPEQTVGWKLESFVSRYFLFTEGSKTVTIPLTENLVENQWYGLVFNYAAQFKQINFSIWTINTDRRATTDLSIVFTKTINGIDAGNKCFGAPFVTFASPQHQTNIRLFKEIIPQELQSTILNQYLVGDSDEVIIIDNALPTLHIPYLGDTK